MSRFLFVVLSLGLAACGSASPRSGFEDGPSSGGDGGTTGAPGPGNLGSSSGGPAPVQSAECTEAAKLVYVVSTDNDLYRFEPDKLTFTKIGPIACDAGGAAPNSMSIDRSGTAWLNYADGSLFEVSTKDASCTPTSFERGQNGFLRFGMAFVSTAAGSNEETLFVSGIKDTLAGQTGQGLATVDLAAMSLAPVGDYDGTLARKGAELTGTGDGRLYGFFTTSPYATLAEIDRGTAATSNVVSLEGVNTGVAWAFSFWGGDFWFYTASSGGPSRVTRLTTATGGLEEVLADVGGFRIVGAGVSTCAPLSSPK